MPVILTSEEDCETWLTGSDEDALALQTPAPDDLLQIVATGSKTDAVPA
jgi:putative SOS response-associated peptidase YedK